MKYEFYENIFRRFEAFLAVLFEFRLQGRVTDLILEKK